MQKPFLAFMVPPSGLGRQPEHADVVYLEADDAGRPVAGALEAHLKSKGYVGYSMFVAEVIANATS